MADIRGSHVVAVVQRGDGDEDIVVADELAGSKEIGMEDGSEVGYDRIQTKHCVLTAPSIEQGKLCRRTLGTVAAEYFVVLGYRGATTQTLKIKGFMDAS